MISEFETPIIVAALRALADSLDGIPHSVDGMLRQPKDALIVQILIMDMLFPELQPTTDKLIADHEAANANQEEKAGSHLTYDDFLCPNCGIVQWAGACSCTKKDEDQS